MNNLAITPYIGMHALQIQNVKRNTTKKVSINELNSIETKDEVVSKVNTISNTTKIDDLPSDNKDVIENVSNNSINE